MGWPLTLEETAALVKRRCVTIGCDLRIDEAALCAGDPRACTSILRFLFTRFAAGLTEHLVQHGHAFDGRMSDRALIDGILVAWPLVSARPAVRATTDKILSTTDWVGDRLLFTLHCIMACTQKAAELASIHQVETMRSRLTVEGTGQSGLQDDSLYQADMRSGLVSTSGTMRQQVFNDSSQVSLTGDPMLSTYQWMAQVYREQLQTVPSVQESLPRQSGPLLDASEQAEYAMQLAEDGIAMNAGVCNPDGKADQERYAKAMAKLDLIGRNGGLEEQDEGVLARFETSFVESSDDVRSRVARR